MRAGRALVERGQAAVVALTLADAGALLVTADGVHRGRAPASKVVSAVGAGDSFLGGRGWGLAAGADVVEAFRTGIAAGTAAVLRPGTELCAADDVLRLRRDVEVTRLSG
jgi:6-phosphofructokinase 2